METNGASLFLEYFREEVEVIIGPGEWVVLWLNSDTWLIAKKFFEATHYSVMARARLLDGLPRLSVVPKDSNAGFYPMTHQAHRVWEVYGDRGLDAVRIIVDTSACNRTVQSEPMIISLEARIEVTSAYSMILLHGLPETREARRACITLMIEKEPELDYLRQISFHEIGNVGIGGVPKNDSLLDQISV